jgi:hypothetical protein
VLLQNSYRLIDLFFTLDINATIDVISKMLNERIDYYFIQNKPSFIQMIDELGGLQLKIDNEFARAYKKSNGNQILDGWHTYEYIRFIDRSHFSSKGNSKSLEDLELETKYLDLAYEQRQFRQKKVINALHKKFNFDDLTESSSTIKQILDKGTVNTNIDYKTAIWIIKNLMTGSKISFGTLPGYYKKNGNNLYYIPDKPGFQMLQNQLKREIFNVESDNKKANIILIMKILKSLLIVILITTCISSYAQQESFIIEKGDVLSIEVMEHPEFNRSNINVLPDGYIQYPAIGGIHVAGLTSSQLADSLVAALDEDYVINPVVTVYVNKMTNQSVNIFGYVNNPGRIILYKPR